MQVAGKGAYRGGACRKTDAEDTLEQRCGKDNIGTLSSLYPADVVINLCDKAVPQPERFSRVLEIVPYADDERQASRVKYKIYRNQGLDPQTHEINK